MRVLVTGGAGYIGSHVVSELLAHGFSVRVLDNLSFGGQSLLSVWSHPEFEFMRADLRNDADLKIAVADAEAVVHLAAIVGDPACKRDPELATAVNLDGSLRLIEHCQRAGVRRFLFASTCSNYGRMADGSGFVDESTELVPQSHYARTKVAVERVVLDPTRIGDVCATCLRFATIFGVSPRMRFDLTVNEFTASLLVNKRLMVYGEHFWRPYVHVRDAARAVRTVLQAEAGTVRANVFNIGSTSQNFTKRDLVGMIAPLAGDAQIEYVGQPDEPRDYRVSFKKANAVLGFETTKTVRDGILEVAGALTSGIFPDWTDAVYRN